MVHLVTAIIKHHRLESVKEALEGVGFSGMTVTEVRGHGRQGGHTETYRGAEYQVDFLPKLKVELVVDSGDVEKVVDVVTQTARTGAIGDGKIWTVALDALVRIRTGERNGDAV